MAEELDLSKAISEVQQMLSSEEGENQIQSLLGMLTGGGQNSDAETETRPDADTAGANPLSFLTGGKAETSAGLGDIEMIMKIKDVMSAVNSQKSNSNTAFLQALRPFLKEERREKLDKAAKIISVTKAMKMFKDLGLGGV